MKLEVGVERTVAVLGGWHEGSEDVVHMELFSCTEGSKVIPIDSYHNLLLTGSQLLAGFAILIVGTGPEM